MAIAYTQVASYPDMRTTVYDITLDGSYASGGYAVTAASLGVLGIDSLDCNWATGEGFTAAYVTSTGKIKCFKNAAGAGAFTECVNTDLTSSMKVRVTVIGKPIL
jgi:hypothetical protein